MGAQPMQLPPRKLRRMRTMLQAGHSAATVARELGISVPVVYRIADEHGFPRRRGMNGGAVRRTDTRPPLARAREAADHRERVVTYWLSADPTLSVGGKRA